MKILIVDDEFVSRQKLKMLLTPFGSCDTTNSGEEAILRFCDACVNHVPYDLITLDIDLPGLKGPEVLQKVRAFEAEQGRVSLENRVKVLMVTAMNDGKSIMAAFKEGCEGYLTKPFSKEGVHAGLAKIGL